MQLTRDETIFINIHSFLNANLIKYWTTFSDADVNKYDPTINHHCILINGKYQLYTIHISDDQTTFKKFKKIIDDREDQFSFEGCYFKDGKLLNRMNYNHIRISRYAPFYTSFQSDSESRNWCSCLFPAKKIRRSSRLIQSRDEFIDYIYSQDFIRDYVSIKTINVKVMKLCKIKNRYRPLTNPEKSWWKFQ